MQLDVRDLIQRIHASSDKVVLAVTGGGASAVSWLLGVPGASRTILEAVVPYSERALDEWLGIAPPSYCSEDTARRLAIRARDRAAWLAPGERVVGVGCTASLRSDRPKQGPHRVHLAVATTPGVISESLTLAKEQRDREGEEEVASRLILNALAEALALQQRLSIPFLPGEEVLRCTTPGGKLSSLLRGDCHALCVEPDGRLRADPPGPIALVAGSFNPLHHGHLGMAQAASQKAGRPAAFELSVANPDKGVISLAEVRRRVSQFSGVGPVWLTRAVTFERKAHVFPGVLFVVGADTASRIVEARYYGDSIESMLKALSFIRTQGCRFLVAGRSNADGKFVELADLAIPVEFADLFEALPGDEFRADVSSTALRAVYKSG